MEQEELQKNVRSDSEDNETLVVIFLLVDVFLTVAGFFIFAGYAS